MRILSAAAVLAIAFAGPVPAMEFNRDRPGGDLANFAVPPLPAVCEAACAANAACKAWTYVKPGIQGPSARCWVKAVVPPKVKSNCCVSGVKAFGGGGIVQKKTDRPGGDYTSVTLPQGSKDEACRALCYADGICKAWTFVKKGYQAANPRCWLKSVVPPPVPSDCCTSGVK